MSPPLEVLSRPVALAPGDEHPMASTASPAPLVETLTSPAAGDVDAQLRRPPGQTRRLLTGAPVAIVLVLIALLSTGRIGSTRLESLFAEALGALGGAHPELVAAAVAISLVSVVNRGRLHQCAHRCVQLRGSLGPMVAVSSAAYALNKVAKTAGAGGVALFVRHGHQRGFRSGSVAAAYMVASLSAQIGLGVVVALAFATAAASGSLGAVWVGTAIGFVVWLGMTVLVLAVVLHSRERLRRVFGLGVRLCRRVAQRFGKTGPTEEGAMIDDFFDAVCAARRHPRHFLTALAYGTADKLLGALVLACALTATGASVSFTTVLQAFAVALVAATIGILPAGVGAVEASMVALLTQRGIDLPTASAAVVIFRMIDFWVPLAVGTVAARSLVARTATDSPAESPTATTSATGPASLAEALVAVPNTAATLTR